MHTISQHSRCAFRCPVDHLEAAPLLATHLAAEAGGAPVCIVSPDIGGAKRAQRVQEILAARSGREVGFALIEKRRSSGVVSGGEQVIGPVAGCRAVIVDDLISAGTTLMRGVKACRAAGAARVDAFATHGVSVPESKQLLGPDGPDSLIITDSILPTRIGGAGERVRRSCFVRRSLCGGHPAHLRGRVSRGAARDARGRWRQGVTARPA